MTGPAFTFDMLLVLVTIGLAVVLLITEWVRADVVGLMAMISLPMLGLIEPNEALSGLSGNAVISIGAVMVIGKGLDKTGLISRLVEPLVSLGGGRPRRLVVVLSGLVAVMSSFVQNIGAAALVLPAIQRISRLKNVPVSRMLMPIGFAAITGGTMTLIGTSPLILINDLIAPYGLERLNLFTVTPIGLALTGSGILLFALWGGRLLPRREEGREHIGCLQHSAPAHHYELSVPSDFSDHLTAQEMRESYDVRLVCLNKADHGGEEVAPEDRFQISPGDTLAVVGDEDHVHRLAGDGRLDVKPELDVFAELLEPQIWGRVEAVVGPRSYLGAKTLGEIHFRAKYQLNVLAVFRGDKVIRKGLEELKLRTGDSLMLEGLWEKFRILAEQDMLIFCSPVKQEKVPSIKTFWAGLWFAVGLSLVLFFGFHLSIGLLTGAVGMVITRVITIDQAYRAVYWRTIFLLAGLMPLGLATLKTGVAAWLAHQVMTVLNGVPPTVVLLALGGLAALFTLVVSNVGAVVLLVPLAVSIAQQMGLDPRLAVLVVALGTSNSFILPTHQVNALYMGAGRYKTSDFIKAGSMASVLFLVVLVTMIQLFY